MEPPTPTPAEGSDPGVATAVGGAAGRRSGVILAGVPALLLVQAQADVALQGRWGQPLLGEAALQEGDAGAEVGQPVDPARDLPCTQQLRSKQTGVRWRRGGAAVAPHLLNPGFVTDLGQRGGEVIAVLVHQVVGVAPEILPQLLHDFIHVVLREVCGAQNDGLPVGTAGQDGNLDLPTPSHTHLLEFEGLPQLGRVAWVDLEDPAERVRVTPVCKFCRNDGAEVEQTSGDEHDHMEASQR